MSPFKIGKTENEKIMERRTKLSRWRSEIERAVRSYERNVEQNLENIKTALNNENEQKARLFATNVIMLNSAISGLKDYKLFLDNIDLNLQFAKTTKDIWASLKEGSQDLMKSQLSDKQLNQINVNIDNIMISSEQIQDRLSSQLDQITSSVGQISQRNPEKVSDILEDVKKRIGVMTSANGKSESPDKTGSDDEAVDELIKKLGEKSRSKKEK